MLSGIQPTASRPVARGSNEYTRDTGAEEEGRNLQYFVLHTEEAHYHYLDMQRV